MTDSRSATTGETIGPVDMLRRLVAFDTTSHRSNLALIDFAMDYLAGHGLSPVRIPDPTGEKAGLLVSVGPEQPGGIVLSGHTDVVPVAGQDWTTDPFNLVERNGRLHGRGSADMKGFIAVALSLVPKFLARDLRVPIHLAFSYDEEIGCLGAGPLLDRIAALVPAPLLAVIGEPTEMRVVNAHRGIVSYTTRVTGRPGHASMTHKGVSAIAFAARGIAFLDQLADELRAAPDIDSGVEPPFSTINVGRIRGGAARNIIAPECLFDWELRPTPGIDPVDILARFQTFVETDLLPDMRRVAPEAMIETETANAVPAFIPQPGSPAEELLLALTGQNAAVSAPFATEAGLFQAAGIPAVIIGPGSPDQAHRADEFVPLADLDSCADLLLRLADWATKKR